MRATDRRSRRTCRKGVTSLRFESSGRKYNRARTSWTDARPGAYSLPAAHVAPTYRTDGTPRTIRTYRVVGFANLAGSILAFGCTVFNVYTLRPSSQLIVHLNGI